MGIDSGASSGSRELSTKDLDKLIAGTRGSKEPVVIIGGTEGHNITSIIGDIPYSKPIPNKRA